MDFASKAISGLEEASQKHEEHIVIDFGIDRLVMFVACYFLGALAILSVVVVVVGPVSTCNPPYGSKSDAVATFTNTFCWGPAANNESFCKEYLPFENLKFRKTHKNMKFLYKWLPYVIGVQMFCFITPWVYWHFVIGARLNGQLKYMRVLLKEIFERLKVIKRGFYNDKPYDRRSETFNGSECYKSEARIEKLEDVEEYRDGLRQRQKKYNHYPSGTAHDMDKTLEEVQDSADATYDKITEEHKSSVLSLTGATWNRFLANARTFISGNLKDRHLFSMFCYENFSSLEYLPYILSVFEMSKKIGGTHGEDPDINYYDMNEAILYQWCHKHNFINNFLTAQYLGKHVFVAMFSLVFIIVMTFWMMFAFDSDISTPSVYRCYLPHEEICVLCSINGRREALIIFFVDYTLIILIFLATLYHLYFMRRATRIRASHYFDDMKKTCSVAFIAARLAKKGEEKEKDLRLELMKILKPVLLNHKMSQQTSSLDVAG